MPHAAKITFAFLTHVADEKDVCGRFDLRPLERIGHSQKGSDSGCIVTDPGTVKPVAFFTRLQSGALGKDSIEMRADADEGRSCVMQEAKNISQIVALNTFKTESGESLQQPLAARGLAKGGSGDFSKFALPAAKLHFLIVQV